MYPMCLCVYLCLKQVKTLCVVFFSNIFAFIIIFNWLSTTQIYEEFVHVFRALPLCVWKSALLYVCLSVCFIRKVSLDVDLNGTSSVISSLHTDSIYFFSS